jgi:hypothetical protein
MQQQLSCHRVVFKIGYALKPSSFYHLRTARDQKVTGTRYLFIEGTFHVCCDPTMAVSERPSLDSSTISLCWSSIVSLAVAML